MKIPRLMREVLVPKREWFRKNAPAHLHFIYSVAEGIVPVMCRRFNDSFAYAVTYVRNGQFSWYWQVEDIIRLRNKIISRTIQNPRYPDLLIDRWQPSWRRFIKLFDLVCRTNLKQLSDRQLADFYVKIYDAFSWHLALNQVTDCLLTTGAEDWFFQILKRRLPKLTDAKLNEVFKILTAPVENSFSNEEHIHLLDIACQIRRQPILYRLFRQGNLKEIVRVLQRFPQISKLLSRHVDRFFWTENNYYRVFLFDVNHYIRKLVLLFRQSPDPRPLLRHEVTRVVTNRRRKKTVIKQYQIPGDVQAITHLIDRFTIWQDTRKSSVFRNNHCLHLFLKEAARRTGLPLAELYATTPYEFEGIVVTHRFDRRLWQERQKGCVFIYSRRESAVFSGRELRLLPEDHFFDLGDSIGHITGVAASPGKVRGRVRIIATNADFSKMRQGEILVTNNTTPEFVPLMKKARAIVTEQGGMTTHAAIVSRELGIPCVIGTRIATQVLKNGELIEVDAVRGVIRKLK